MYDTAAAGADHQRNNSWNIASSAKEKRQLGGHHQADHGDDDGEGLKEAAWLLKTKEKVVNNIKIIERNIRLTLRKIQAKMETKTGMEKMMTEASAMGRF